MKHINKFNENIEMNSFEYHLETDGDPIILKAPFLLERHSRFMYEKNIYIVDLVFEYHTVHCKKVLDNFNFAFD